LDYWWFVLAGKVCCEAPQPSVFEEGQAFGFDVSKTPSMCGAATDEGGCQVVRVTRQHYLRAQSEGELDTFRMEKDGELVRPLLACHRQ
jgi:hypothetical protein